ncbi:unnamed protein product [Haemonchus placei]|uniref:Uncharacterized protein n=1 Tax=Haemonchus placei TaxID=6290 RepID=A0A3P7V5W6_HAEPC|nr:unnamed protein product [Haemonchus placei]
MHFQRQTFADESLVSLTYSELLISIDYLKTN